MRLNWVLLPALLLVEASALAQSVDAVTPAAATRGTTAVLRVDGTALGSVSDVTTDGGGVAVSDVVVESDERLRVTVQVSDRAEAGPRDLTLVGDATVEVIGAFEVRPGAPDVIFVSPAVGARGDVVDVTLGGRNLDIVTGTAFGAGISVSDWTVSDPTRATASLDIGPAATTGDHTITLAVDEIPYLAEARFEVEGGTPALTGLAPAEGIRGENVEVVIEGRNLDTLISAAFGSRIDVSPLIVSNPTRALVTVELRDDTPRGPRDVVARNASGELFTLTDGFEVQPGPMSVVRLRPDRVGQGAISGLTFEGENLDGVLTVDCGDGVATTEVDASQPLELVAVVEVAEGAPLGFRDCVLDGADGSYVAEDILIVEEPTLPPVQLRFEEEISLGDVEVGAWVRRNIVIENLGERDEQVVVGDAQGDIDLFALLGDDGRRISEVTLDIAAGDSAAIRVEYHPEGQNQSSAAFALQARDEEVGQILMRAFGIAQTLTFDPESPADLGVVAPDVQVALPRVDLDLTGAGLPESVEIDAIELEVFYNNAPVEADDYFTLDLQSTRGGDAFYWGNTELQWDFEGPIGSYRGLVLVYTDSDTAGMVPFSFSFAVRDDTGEDAGDTDVDAGDTGVADTGEDTGTDTGVATDTGGGTDTGSPDTGAADTGTADVADTSPETDAGDTGPGDDTGCCSTTGAPRSPWSTLALMGAVLWWRRRWTR